MQYQSFLIKYAEIGTKGKNRYMFEDALIKQIRYALKSVEGQFDVTKESGRIYVKAETDYDYDDAVEALKRVFGIADICPMVQIEDKDYENLKQHVVEYMDQVYPDKNDPNVMYFESGIHEPTDTTGKCFRIPSNTTVYLEGGAVLKGRLNCDSVENVKILGHGMLLEPQQGISIAYSKNVLIEGITVINSRHYTVSGGQSTGITIKNLKSFSYQGWSDGLDFMSCSDVTIDDVFLRNSDDCIALYTHRWNFYGDCRNVRVLNSTLWADIAHPINIGTHGNTETGDEVLEDMLFKNIDILEHDEDDRDYQGCMAINVGDHNLAQNITFEDIRVEHIQEGQLFHLRVMYNRKYNTGPGRGVRNIVFRNISCTGKFVNPSLFEGYDKDRKVEDILFENIVLNGKRVTSPDELNINKREFVDKMHIK